MGTEVAVSCTMLFIVLDVLLTTVLYIHGSHLRRFTQEALDFNILGSALDLWGTVLLRASFLLGASIGVSWNKQEGPSRVAKFAILVLLTFMLVITYSLAKLLMLSEQESLNHQPWSLSLICWTCASSLGVILFWKQLGRASNSVSSLSSRQGFEDTEKLVETAGEEEREEEKTNSRATLGRLLSYSRKDSGLLSVAVLFLLISALCEAFIPYYYGVAIDSIVVHQSMEYFAKPVVTVAVLALVSSFAMGVRGGVFTLTMARLNLRLRNHLFRTLMSQEIAFFDENHTGDILSRLSADTTQVSDLISQNVNIFLRSAIKGVGFFIFMFKMSWKLTLVTVMGFPFIALVSKVYGEYYKKLTKEVQTTLAEANKVAEETISAMRTVRSFANEGGEADSYYAKLFVMFQLNKKQALAYACYMWSSSTSELALEVAVLYYGGHLVLTGQMSSGGLISFFIYMLELGECFASIASVYTGLMQGVGAAEKVFEYLDRKPKHPAEGADAPDICTGLVEFKDITFAYPTRSETDILKVCSCMFCVGEKGTQLSGGQKQRVAIARALIRNPRVLVLDEATSALDAESEHIVQQALNNIMQEHTVMVIAHRLSTVEKADNIVVIDGGLVAEQGSHDELMASGGLYCKLVQRQVLGNESRAEVLNPAENIRWKSSSGQLRNRTNSNSSGSESDYNMRY
uniref:ATP-binding cassette, sub-family B (MDR/TAP), member 9 n=1 Tax=Nothobranchius kuhntae TaxID=321403 RepID=A0A1A8HUC3_NOTKU